MSRILKSIVFCVLLFLLVRGGTFLYSLSNIKLHDSLVAEVTSESSNRLTNIGRATFDLTSPEFQCTNFLNSVNSLSELNIAFLYNTFGNDFDCLITLLHDPRLKRLEIHLINEPCQTNHRCGSYEFLAPNGIAGTKSRYEQLLNAKSVQLHNKFLDYSGPLVAVLNRHLQSNTQLYVSGGLESQLSERAYRTMAHWIDERFPTAKVVWNPFSGSGNALNARADLVEGHGPYPKTRGPNCITNLDGTDVDFINRKSTAQDGNYIQSGAPLQQYFEEMTNRCEIAFLWVVEDNCGPNPPGVSFIDPRQRRCNPGRVNDYAAGQVLNVIRNGLKEPDSFVYDENDRKSFRGCVGDLRNPQDGFKTGFLIKQSQFRDRGGVIILPGGLHASRISVVARGQIIDTYTSGGRYGEDGSNRDLWRSNKSPTKYPFKVAIRLNTSDGTVCYKVDNPRIRND